MLKNYFFLGLLFIFLSGINAQKTYIPDDNFEQTLIDYGIDSDGIVNDSVAIADISGITQLYIDNKSISDLTGIEDFISLVWFGCDNNQLISLDVSQNSSLFSLSCQNNQLTSVNINGLTDLTALYVDNNQLTYLSLNQNLNLQSISCSNNQITSLSVFANIYLTGLSCDNNQITTLEVSQNRILSYLNCNNNQMISIDFGDIDLEGLNCSNNQLTSLDLSKNTWLQTINCSENQLASLNVKNGNNSMISNFNATNNPLLLCIQVDNETDANNGASPYNNWQKDAIATYSEDCESYLGVDDEILSEGLILYPNPISDILTVDSKIPIKKVEIFNILGQKEIEINSGFNYILLNNLTRGFYIIKIYSEKGSIVRKLIKK